MTPPQTAVKRACDACHRRKVKCDSGNPCRNCGIAQLGCTYNAIPQKKGPKGSRAKVISELRENQRLTSLAARVHNRINNIPPPGPNNLEPSSGMLTADFVKECLNFYFDHLYAKAPILERSAIESSIQFMEQNRDVYCLFASLCAFVMLQPGMMLKNQGDMYQLHLHPSANITAASLLLEEAQRVRKGHEYMESPSFHSIATSLFLASTYAAMEYQDKAWAEVREATTMINIAEWHDEKTYGKFDVVQGTRARRLYWLFYVMERSFSFSRNRPITLEASIVPPSMTDDPSDPLAHTLGPFLTLVDTYRPLDGHTLRVWNAARRKLDGRYITSLATQSDSTIDQLRRQDPNALDTHLNMAWLKDILWRLSPSAQANSQGSADATGFDFPSDAAKEILYAFSSQFVAPCMEIMLNGGLMKTLLETLSNVLNLINYTPHLRGAFRVGPRERLDQLVGIIALVRGGAHEFLPLLFHKIGEALPRLASTLLDEEPDLGLADFGMATMANDMFDGFGFAGMSQMPPQGHMSAESQHASMSMETPMQMPTDQHSSPQNQFEAHSSPPMQLHIDSQSTASMIKIEPQPTPQMRIPMDPNHVTHQPQSQSQQQQIQMPMTMSPEFDPAFAVDGFEMGLDHNFAAISSDPNIRASMQRSLQGSMQEGIDDQCQRMNGINGINNVTGVNINGISNIMQIPPDMMANEHHGGFWS